MEQSYGVWGTKEPGAYSEFSQAKWDALMKDIYASARNVELYPGRWLVPVSKRRYRVLRFFRII